MDYFKLTRAFWDFAFENPEKIKPNHCALYLFIIEHCNRLGWKKKFGLPTEMTKEAIGIRSYNTYIQTLNELVGFGLIELIEKSKNQYSSNIVAISNFDKALDKALDKASIKHASKQSESTLQSIDSIDKHITNNNIQLTTTDVEVIEFSESLNICMFDENWKKDVERVYKVDKNKINFALIEFKDHCGTIGENKPKSLNNFKKHFTNWVRKKKELQVKTENKDRL